MTESQKLTLAFWVIVGTAIMLLGTVMALSYIVIAG